MTDGTKFTAPPTFAAPAAPGIPPAAPVAAPVAAPTAAPVAPAAPGIPPAAPVAAPTAAPVAPAPTAAPVSAPEGKKKQVRLATKIISDEDIIFVRQNIKTMGYTEMAAKIGLTTHQVNRILQTLKGGIDQNGGFFGLRGKALQAAIDVGEKAYAEKTTKAGAIKPDFTQPITEMAQKVENAIAEKLSRPADTRPGGKTGGPAKQALASQLDDLLADL